MQQRPERAVDAPAWAVDQLIAANRGVSTWSCSNIRVTEDLMFEAARPSRHSSRIPDQHQYEVDERRNDLFTIRCQSPV